jgi:hypothetical protein
VRTNTTAAFAGTTSGPDTVTVAPDTSSRPARSTSLAVRLRTSNHSPSVSDTAFGFCMISVITRSPGDRADSPPPPVVSSAPSQS